MRIVELPLLSPCIGALLLRKRQVEVGLGEPRRQTGSPVEVILRYCKILRTLRKLEGGHTFCHLVPGCLRRHWRRFE